MDSLVWVCTVPETLPVYREITPAVESTGAQQFSVETLMNPAVVRILISIPVYATESKETNPMNGSLGNPLMTDLTFVSGTPAVATVSDQGVVTGVANGTSDVTITSKGSKKLTTTAKVTVTGGAPAPDPTYTVDTTGGSKSFTLTVAETGKSEITYTVTVTVA